MNKLSQKNKNIVLQCAKEYEHELLDKSILIVYRDRASSKICSYTVNFHKGNFMHLTGLTFYDKDRNKVGANHFFDLAVSNRINFKLVQSKADGSTEQKLQVLPIAMKFKYSIRMVGEYNNSKRQLLADICCGTVKMTLAFTLDNVRGLVPCSILNEDIRKLVKHYNPVLAVFEKDVNSHGLYQLCNKSKNYSYYALPIELKKIIEE